jgi:glycosyltransferase involved in cell wall biosynthesis/CDP-glycerol glycerophosphotransferase (TagB/SpsB family)
MTRAPGARRAPGASPAAPAGRPRFSIVTAVYNVEPYLPEYIESIEGQRFDPSRIEVVAVDDGSTDGSLDVLRDWARKSRLRIKVFTKPNGGQGTARNLGLDHATGEWVNFADPDDMLDPDFLRVADRFASRHPEVKVMAGKPVVLQEDVGRISDSHPRRAQYRRGNRVVNLLDEPNVFSGSATVSLFRMDGIAEAGLRFDPRIRPNFEDGHFPVHYLLALEQPVVGLLRDARYVYRRRAAGTSTLQGSLAHPGRFTDVLEHGYLDVIREARERYGAIPDWVQHVLIYELSWYLSADEKISSDIVLPDSIAPRYHELLGRIVRSLDPEVVQRHRVRPLRGVWADILGHGYRDERWHMPSIVRGKVDRDMRLQRVGYRFTGGAPKERFVVDGAPVQPAFAKTRVHRYYGRVLMHERILWLPAGRQVQAFLDGEDVRVRGRWSSRRRRRRERSLRRRLAAWGRLPRRLLIALRRGRARQYLARRARPLQRRLARTAFFRNRYRDAWVLMDRVHDADDNGERLFEHLRAHRPDINAWFVLAPGSRDWDRLKSAGERRLLAWGSFGWRMLMLNARWLLSSHADRGLVEPAAVTQLVGGRPWKFGFLQHGVIKDDLSLWLNQRDIDLFVVSTPAELASVAGDGTSYIVTTKETRNTGLPRFDRLLEKSRSVPPEDRDLVIVAPTWRTWLTLAIDSRTQQRMVDQRFAESEFNQMWLGLLRSEPIRGAVAKRGWRLGYMPHPNLQQVLTQLQLPEWVEPLSFAGTDVQGLYARCALLVTDYSSVAFNVAYIDRPVVYFQFDRAEYARGAHMGRQGYFAYERDGFGPVVEDLTSAEQAVVAAIRHGPRPLPAFQARIEATFPVRDGGASARVVAAIEELSRPYEPVLSPTRPRRAKSGEGAQG